MADNTEILINGDSNSSDFVDSDHPTKTPSPDSDDLITKIDSLSKQNAESTAKIGQLEAEIASLLKEKDQATENAESDRRAAAAIAKRAAELEGEVARLQHDLITAINSGEEASGMVDALRREIEGLKQEKKAAEDAVGELERLLSESKEKVSAMEAKMEEIVRKSEESERVVGGLMEKISEREVDDDDDRKGMDSVNTQQYLSLIGAASVGAVLAGVAVSCYVKYSRNR